MLKLLGLTLAITLAACSPDDPRYKNNELLEKPPTLPRNKVAGDAECCDDAVIPKKRYRKGLGNDVYLTDTTPMRIKIKQPLENAWLTVGLALKQREMKVADHSREQSLFYVQYQPKSLFSMFSSDEDGDIYLLKLSQDGSETAVSAELANPSEQLNTRDDAQSDADDLLYAVFETLRDELEE